MFLISGYFSAYLLVRLFLCAFPVWRYFSAYILPQAVSVCIPCIRVYNFYVYVLYQGIFCIFLTFLISFSCISYIRVFCCVFPIPGYFSVYFYTQGYFSFFILHLFLHHFLLPKLLCGGLGWEWGVWREESQGLSLCISTWFHFCMYFLHQGTSVFLHQRIRTSGYLCISYIRVFLCVFPTSGCFSVYFLLQGISLNISYMTVFLCVFPTSGYFSEDFLHQGISLCVSYIRVFLCVFPTSGYFSVYFLHQGISLCISCVRTDWSPALSWSFLHSTSYDCFLISLQLAAVNLVFLFTFCIACGSVLAFACLVNFWYL